MSYETLYNLSEEHREVSYFARFGTRSEILEKIIKQKFFDIVVVGGGIHGAAIARLAALNGLKTPLVEKSDYASGTSSRSSKMAHGGLRYLEMLDFAQVFEGIRAREDLFVTAPHLVRPYPFYIPVERNASFYKLKISLGLHLYDLFVQGRSRQHRWIPRRELKSELLKIARPNLLGCLQYWDGIMDDTRLVQETILAARQEGATCINYVRFDSFKHEKDNRVTVGLTDVLSDAHLEVGAGIVVNCAGPWAPYIGRLPSQSNPSVRYSRGVHLLFDRPWSDPALFLPLADRGRYYFVWPHPAGTLVGTTEREVLELPEDPLPERDEVEEILMRIERDLPGFDLNRSTLHYAFAGIRTLAVRNSSKSVASISRKHIWSYGQGMLSLLGENTRPPVGLPMRV